jgi:hypothetical protein
MEIEGTPKKCTCAKERTCTHCIIAAMHSGIDRKGKPSYQQISTTAFRIKDE